MADEALACFKSLLEVIPTWIVDLESILKSSADRQEEILFANRPEEPVNVSPEAVTRSKASSLQSRRSRKSRSRDGERAAAKVTQRLTNSDALRLSQRKRKTSSIRSGDHSGPVKYRNRAAAVVYFDGETQKQFEKIVRTVGSTRNLVRKGKISAKVDGFAGMRSGNRSRDGGETSSSSSSGTSSNGGSQDSAGHECSPTYTQADVKSTLTPPRFFGMETDDTTAAFDKVDGCLDKAQSLCERAAHQILRDGDCHPEVSSAKMNFEEALKFVEAELPTLQRRADIAAERLRRSEERKRAEAAAEERRKSASLIHEKIVNVVTTSFSSDGTLEADVLEVDDESDDDDLGEFDLAAMRSNFGTAAQMRSSRLTAH